MSDDLVKRLREDQPVTQDMESTLQCALQDEAADRIEELESDVKAVLRREHDANKKAFEHLRRAEKAEICSKNYAAFNHDWRKRAEAAESKLAKAVEAFTRIDDLTCHNMPMTAREEQGVNREARAALAELEDKTDEHG